MTGSNLPPGCRESDIPGNRPEDLAAEALYDEIYKALEPLGVGAPDMPGFDDAVQKIADLCGKCEQDGYANGQSDGAMWKAMQDQEG